MRKYVIMILFIVLISSAQGAGESVSLGSYDINVNSVVEVPIVINNAADVAGGKVTVGYNSSVIVCVGFLPGDFGAPITKVDSSGTFVEVSSALATGTGKNEAILGIIKFRGVGAGKSDLTIENDYYFNDIKGNLYTPVAKNGSITVGASASQAPVIVQATPQKTQSSVPSPVPTSGQATIKTTQPSTPPAASTQGGLKRPNETAVLPVETKKTSGFEAGIVIFILFTLSLNRKK
ncbi:MAG: hypothetical protein OIN85_09870 [Candidatus Methanoperedens sp.]|nr:hypothetical protein [Candidatus Methanoperedens sp.]